MVHPIGDASGLAQPGMYNPNTHPMGGNGIVYPTNEVVHEVHHDKHHHHDKSHVHDKHDHSKGMYLGEDHHNPIENQHQ
jgi:hypothetical protein